MVKFFARFFVVVLIFILIPYSVLAVGKSVGGEIVNTKAKKIKQLEEDNYACAVAGETIEVRSKGKSGGGTKDYYIPPNIKKNITSKNQDFLGFYRNTTTIFCVYKGYPPAVATVTMPSFSYFKNSQK